MSGDVQPKKRKDKRRKKDETPSQEDPVIQPSTPPPADDYSIHVHSDHGTGGGLFAKFVFFVLLSVLVVLIGIVITQNRGLTDLDTPASDSKFAKIFEGWLDESTPEHDDHAAVEFGDDHDDEHGEEHGDEEHADDEHEEEHDEDEHSDKDEEPSDDHAESAEDEQVSEDKEEETEQASEEDEEQQVSEDEEQDNEQSIDEASEEPEDDEQGDDGDDDDKDDDDKTEELDTITNEEDDTNEDNDDIGDVVSQEDQQEGDNNDDDDTVEDDEDDGDDNENPFNEEADDNDDEKSEENQVQSEEDNPDEHDGGSQEISTENEVIEEDSVEEQTEGADDDDEQEEVIDNSAGEEELMKQEAEKNIEAEEESSNGQNKDNKTSVEESAGAPSSRRHTIVSPPPLEQIEHDIQNVEDEYSEEEAEEESEEDIHIEPVQSKSQYLELRTTYQKLTPEEEIREKIAGLIGQHTGEQTPFFDEPADEYEEEEEDEEGYDDEEVEVQGDETLEQEEPEQEDPEQEDPEQDDDPEQEEEDVEYGDKEDEIPVEGDEYEEEEEDISDVDDEELLKKLEAKYGKLPQSNKADEDEEEEEEDEEEDIPNKFGSWKKIKVPASEEKNWKKPVPDSKEKLKIAEARIKDNPEIALGIINELIKQHPDDVDVKYGRAKVLDKLAEQKRSNEILQKVISAYYDLLRNHNLPDDIFKKVADRCIDRMRFRGHYSSAVHVHKQLINRFPNEPSYQNQLAVSYLTINRLAEAKRVLQDVLMRWPNNGFAQVHFGFVLKTFDNDISAAVKYLRSGIASREPGVIDGRFYFHLGDALTRLGKPNEATKVYEDGVKYKVFLSRYQRSLYNVDRLTAKPWWQLNDTPYAKFFKMLEEKWKVIRDEGITLLNKAGFFKDESENLRDVGEWKQYELYARGMKFTENCKKCPETCKIIDMFPDARTCKRGQIKFSVMHPGTHVWPHCGPTNCRLRAHLGLKVPPKTYIRVADETRSWEEGKMFLFDDSFEHEVWHNGTELRLVLIVDVWHPELTPAEKNSLPAI